MYARILVPIDASTTSQTAAEHAIALARATKAALRFVHVVDLVSPMGGLAGMAEVVTGNARLLLDDWNARASQWGLDVSTAIAETDARHPRVADAIVAAAGDWRADLIVIGSHGHGGVRHLVLGSVAEGVARRSAVPVLLVHPGQAPVA